MIDGLGNKPSQATALSAIIAELEKSGYEVVTVSNAGSTYSGVELLEIIDSTGNSVENITLQQTDSTILKVNLSMTEGTSKVYVNISGLYYELSLNDTKIELSENGQSNVTGERYTLKLVPTTTKATMKIGETSITSEQTILDGAEITITALSTIGEENFTIKVENEDGTTKDIKTGNITIVQKPIHPTSMTISATGNKTEIDVDEELQLSVTTDPEVITDTITWSSSDTSKATVNNTGLVKGVAEGTATITATAKDGNNNVQKNATYELIVNASNSSISVSELKEGDEVIYTDQNGNTIPCIVLYAKKDSSGNDTTYYASYGIQIISADTVGDDVYLGNGTGSVGQSTNATLFSKAKKSYNTAIATLNNAARDYLNTNLATNARCVGSSPSETPITSETNTGTYTNSDGYFSSYNGQFKSADGGSSTSGDYAQMGKERNFL